MSKNRKPNTRGNLAHLKSIAEMLSVCSLLQIYENIGFTR